jgi:hypothetical protein
LYELVKLLNDDVGTKEAVLCTGAQDADIAYELDIEFRTYEAVCEVVT